MESRNAQVDRQLREDGITSLKLKLALTLETYHNSSCRKKRACTMYLDLGSERTATVGCRWVPRSLLSVTVLVGTQTGYEDYREGEEEATNKDDSPSINVHKNCPIVVHCANSNEDKLTRSG